MLVDGHACQLCKSASQLQTLFFFCPLLQRLLGPSLSFLPEWRARPLATIPQRIQSHWSNCLQCLFLIQHWSVARGHGTEYQQVIHDPIKKVMLGQDAAPAVVMTERKLVKQQAQSHINTFKITYTVLIVLHFPMSTATVITQLLNSVCTPPKCDRKDLPGGPRNPWGSQKINLSFNHRNKTKFSSCSVLNVSAPGGRKLKQELELLRKLLNYKLRLFHAIQ